MASLHANLDLIAQQFALAYTSWSIGVLGALAEFHREEDEPCSIGPSFVVTERGALRIHLSVAPRPFAYESVVAHHYSWNQGVALLLPADACNMHGRRAITEIGPDPDAIRPQDRTGILFDLGLGTPHFDFYVRCTDARPLAGLRAAVGKSLLDDTAHDLMHEIPRWSPHRVFVSRLGRLEVYQQIGAADSVTPEGPHTHLLPKLLRCNRTHSANLALPEDWVPCATLYPANPVRDDHGAQKLFDAAEHHAFQALLEKYGEPDLVQVKHAVWNAVRGGAGPTSLGNLSTRHQRIACRIALRQMLHTDGISPALAAWRAAFDTPARPEIEAAA